VRRIFLLSPAQCGGKRAGLLLRRAAVLPLAVRLSAGGAPLGDVFAFCSGLYFRGKLAYARAFAHPEDALVITPDRGLVPVDEMVTAADLKRFAKVEVDAEEPRYRRPLERDARRLVASLEGASQVVLLGSLATPKYLQPLTPIFGARLRVPVEFAGLGDMSRGALLLRQARAGVELTYRPA
jgi:hypothetical protein